MEVDELGGRDFLDWVGADTSACIFRLLDHPADLVRAAAVSRSWRHFVIDNEFCKTLCRRICPEVASLARVAQMPGSRPRASESILDDEHRIYSRLCGAIVSTKRPSTECILLCLGASSTDNFPAESVENTLQPQERINHRPCYWSSAGADDPDASESLTYRLDADFVVIDEIRIQPFKAYFQPGHPIYSSKAVRIRMGHSKLAPASESFVTDDNENLRVIADENYVWTYTSPEFPMLQENVLQSFKLPRPVFCIGGVVRIELLGGVQKQATDDRYYVCVCHAQVMGRALSPDFRVHISNPAGDTTLYYFPVARDLHGEDTMPDDGAVLSEYQYHSLVTRYRQTKHLATMNVLPGPVQFMGEGDVTDDDEPLM